MFSSFAICANQSGEAPSGTNQNGPARCESFGYRSSFKLQDSTSYCSSDLNFLASGRWQKPIYNIQFGALIYWHICIGYPLAPSEQQKDVTIERSGSSRSNLVRHVLLVHKYVFCNTFRFLYFFLPSKSSRLIIWTWLQTSNHVRSRQ